MDQYGGTAHIKRSDPPKNTKEDRSQAARQKPVNLSDSSTLRNLRQKGWFNDKLDKWFQ